MFRITITTLIFLLLHLLVRAQVKSLIDTLAIKTWSNIGPIKISNDGYSIAYSIENNPIGSKTLIIKNVYGEKSVSIAGCTEFYKTVFTENSDYCIFKKGKDSVGVIALKSFEIKYFDSINDFMSYSDNRESFLAFTKTNTRRKLHLFNLYLGEHISYENVLSYWFSNYGELVLIQADNSLNDESLLQVSIASLKDSSSIIFEKVTNYSLSGDGNILLIKERTVDSVIGNNAVVFFNLATKNYYKSINVYSFLLNAEERSVILKKNVSKSSVMDTFEVFDLFDKPIKFKLFSKPRVDSEVITSFSFDYVNSQIAFILEQKKDYVQQTTLWLLKIGNADAHPFCVNYLIKSNIEWNIASAFTKFDKAGKVLLFKLFYLDSLSKRQLTDSKVNVWSYLDTKLQSQQMKEGPQFVTSLFSLNINSLEILRIAKPQDSYQIYESESESILISREKEIFGTAGWGEDSWNKAAYYSVFVKKISSGESKLIKSNCQISIRVSPNKRYIYFFDIDEQDYFCYDLVTDKLRNITNLIPTPLAGDANGKHNPPDGPYEELGWLQNDEFVYIYDEYDIWKVDPTCRLKPINLTNGFGRKFKYKLRLVYDHRNVPFSNNESVLLCGFNSSNKKNGFFRIFIESRQDPILLSVSDYLYFAPPMESNYKGMVPIKAKKNDVYIVGRMSFEESLNYFATTDFKVFHRVSNVCSEKKYNWVTAELISWKVNGKRNQGILYKPENFDRTKKYPLIFVCYELLSDGLNVFPIPQLSNGSLNISYFVSNGYLVFAPDIYYKLGKPGTSALKSVSSAVRYLKRFSYIDSEKIGIQGHSFGGYEVNYIITQANIFAAACSGAGTSDLISTFGTLREKSFSNQSMDQLRPGGTLWENPDVYIRQSPVFYSQNVNTPLLMFHTTDDGAVDFNQALELFTALRSLGKKVWLLEYTDGYHGVSGKSALDFTIRMKQFFDHYLLDIPAPKWMTQGVPAIYKGKYDGLELDFKSNGPGPSLNTIQKRRHKTLHFLK